MSSHTEWTDEFKISALNDDNFWNELVVILTERYIFRNTLGNNVVLVEVKRYRVADGSTIYVCEAASALAAACRTVFESQENSALAASSCNRH